MIHRLQKFTAYQKKVFQSQIRSYIAGWDDCRPEHTNVLIEGNCILSRDSDLLPDDEPTTWAGYKCDCGTLIAEYEDYSGRDIEDDRCPRCNAHYDYTEQELADL